MTRTGPSAPAERISPVADPDVEGRRARRLDGRVEEGLHDRPTDERAGRLPSSAWAGAFASRTRRPASSRTHARRRASRGGPRRRRSLAAARVSLGIRSLARRSDRRQRAVERPAVAGPRDRGDHARRRPAPRLTRTPGSTRRASHTGGRRRGRARRGVSVGRAVSCPGAGTPRRAPLDQVAQPRAPRGARTPRSGNAWRRTSRWATRAAARRAAAAVRAPTVPSPRPPHRSRRPRRRRRARSRRAARRPPRARSRAATARRRAAPRVPVAASAGRSSASRPRSRSSRPRPRSSPGRSGLPDGRLPATGQALAGPQTGRVAEQLLEDVAEDDVGEPADDRVADRQARAGGRRQGRDAPPARRPRASASSSGGTNRRSVARNAIGAGSASASRSSSSPVSRPTRSTTAATRSAVVGGRRTVRRGRRGRPVGVPARGATARRGCRSASLAVVAAPQVRVAQPVVGDVDALRQLEAVGSGDVRVVLAQQRPPGELDRLGAGVAGHAEPGVQVVGGEGRSGRHGRATS